MVNMSICFLLTDIGPDVNKSCPGNNDDREMMLFKIVLQSEKMRKYCLKTYTTLLVSVNKNSVS